MSSKPDLVFHYSRSIPSTIVNLVQNDTVTIQTTNGLIFADEDLTQPIGTFIFNITVVNTNEIHPDNLYQGSGTNTYFLPEGAILHSINLTFEKSLDGGYAVPPDQSNLFGIVNGNKDFLNQRGIVVQSTRIKGQRTISVFFEKPCCV